MFQSHQTTAKVPLRQPWSGYALAAGAVAAATAVRWLLDPLLGDLAHYALFFFAVALAGAIAGWRAGMLAAVLAGFPGVTLFVHLPGRFQVNEPGDYIQLGVYLVTCILITRTVDVYGRCDCGSHARGRRGGLRHQDGSASDPAGSPPQAWLQVAVVSAGVHGIIGKAVGPGPLLRPCCNPFSGEHRSSAASRKQVEPL